MIHFTPPSHQLEVETGDDTDDFEYYQDDDEPPRDIEGQEDIIDNTGNVINQQPAYDRMINSEVQLQNGTQMSLAKVRRRAIGPDGKVTGEYHEDP